MVECQFPFLNPSPKTQLLTWIANGGVLCCRAESGECGVMAFVLSAQGLACHCVSGQPLGLTHTGACGCSAAQTRHRSLASCAHKYICQRERERGRGVQHWGGVADSLHSATAGTAASHIQSRAFGYFLRFPSCHLNSTFAASVQYYGNSCVSQQLCRFQLPLYII